MIFDFQNLVNWFLVRGSKIVLILISAFFINRFLQLFLKKGLERGIIEKGIKNKLDKTKKQRIETLISVFGGTARFVIWVVAILMILPELGINVAPILAGMGLTGLAIGMAAKDMISDFISGIFIILEDQYRVGDKIKIAGIEGEVVEITLRKTVIKDKDNFLHLIPNSQIKTVSKIMK